MKWYPLAHSAAVTMLCRALSTAVVVSEIRQWDCQNLALSFLLYIFKFPDSRCRPLVSLSDNLNPFQRCRVGKHTLCMGREWPHLGGLVAPRNTKDHRLIGIHFFLARARKSPKNRHSIHYSSSCRGKHLIGDSAMVIVKFPPRWPHTWRYALHALSRPTMTSGRLG